MECNKDEALRAKDIAERKFNERDYAGAKKFALKAQTLYPGLEGISHMLTTLEVYISAEDKLNGEMDMYAILGVNPLADDETIKKQYRRLVLQLHPDKNKSVGADGAFQLVSEAFNFLSDKAKRAAYNSRRSFKSAQQKVPFQSGAPAGAGGSRQSQQKFPSQNGVPVPPPKAGKTVDQKVPNSKRASSSSASQQKVPTQSGNSASEQKVPTQSGSSPVPSMNNGYHKTASSMPSAQVKQQKSSNKKGLSSTSAQGFFKKGDTFWTACTRCKMQYEYMRVYLNQNLKCPTCQEAFLAVELPPPSNLTPLGHQQKQQKPGFNYNFDRSFGGMGARWSPLFGMTTYNTTSSAAAGPAHAASVRQPTNEGGKRERVDVPAAAFYERTNDSSFISRGEGSMKKARVDDSSMRNFSSTTIQMGTGKKETANGSMSGQSKENWEAGRTSFFAGTTPSSKLNFHRELSLVELRKMLAEKALVEIRKKLNEWKLSREAGASAKQKGKSQKRKPAKNISKQDVENCKESSGKQEDVEMAVMTVPDADFHDFDSERSENCFGENQVWATYDHDDGMPRLYALVHEVISSDPFKVRLSWLRSKSNAEFSSLDWVAHGFLKTSGQFWVGKHETFNSLNAFSHKVKWTKGPRGVIQIYPQKGDIWALYRDWSPDWNEDTPDETVHSYEMVEVLDEYNEEGGVSVAPLCKATGFRTVFHKQQDPKEARRIPKEEMFRFSHQVPSRLLTGEEKPNAPKGFVELDPAATPTDLLEVISSNDAQKLDEKT